MERLPFYSDCVNWPRPLLAVLEHLVDEGVAIRRETFLRRVDMEARSGAPWYPEAWDYHLTYWRLPGYRIYWYVHSSTEIVFAAPGEIARLREAMPS